jgi:hypothetical protein
LFAPQSIKAGTETKVFGDGCRRSKMELDWNWIGIAWMILFFLLLFYSAGEKQFCTVLYVLIFDA